MLDLCYTPIGAATGELECANHPAINPESDELSWRLHRNEGRWLAQN